MAMLNIAQIRNLDWLTLFTWKQILLLAALGVVAGVVLALTVSLPVC